MQPDVNEYDAQCSENATGYGKLQAELANT